MAYIGRQLVRGQNRIYDDISSSFNGSTTAFNLTIGGDATPPAQVNQLWIVLGGILQKPGTDFTVADAQVTFTTAPAAGLDFWAMIQGDTSDMNAPSDGSVTPTKIATSGDFSFPEDIRLTDADGSHYVGIQAPTTVSSNLVWTLPAADGSANQILKTNGSGVLGWATDSATDSTKMPLAGGTFTGNVTFNDSIEARFGTGADLKIYHDGSNSIISDTGTGNLYIDATSEYHVDNKKVVFGTGADLQLYHDGSNSYITNATGNIAIEGKAGEMSIKCIPDGAVEIYHNDSKKLESTATGISVTGKVEISDDLDLTGASYNGRWDKSANALEFDDSAKIVLGTGGDLEIYHSSSHSFIKDAGTGNLQIWTNQLSLLNAAGDESMIQAVENAQVELYHDNVKRFETTSAGCKVSAGHLDLDDSQNIRLGNSQDFLIYHNGSNSIINDNGTGNLELVTNGTKITFQGGSDTMANFIKDGAAELYFDNTKVLETHANGFYVKGPEGGVASVYLYADEGDDDQDKWRIESTTGGELHFESKTSGSWEDCLHLVGNGSAKLFCDHELKLHTTSSGALVTASGTPGLEVKATDINSNGPYFKVWNSDSVYGGGFQQKNNNALGGIEFLNSSGAVSAGFYNSTGGWHWGSNIILDGSGIRFNGDTAAANELDDYEEGTWTPVLGALTTNPTVSSYAAQLGTYTKVGNVVHVRGYLDISAGNIGTDGAGDGLIAGLPFTSNSDNTQNPGGWMENFKNIPNSFSSNRDNACLYLAANTTSIYLHQFNSGNPQYQTGWGIGSIDNGNRFQWQFAGSYRI